MRDTIRTPSEVGDAPLLWGRQLIAIERQKVWHSKEVGSADRGGGVNERRSVDHLADSCIHLAIEIGIGGVYGIRNRDSGRAHSCRTSAV